MGPACSRACMLWDTLVRGYPSPSIVLNQVRLVVALSVTASCDIKQAKRELCKMSMHDMQLSMEFGGYLFSKGNVTLLKCTWNSCGGLKHPSLTCQINRLFFVFFFFNKVDLYLYHTTYRPFLGWRVSLCHIEHTYISPAEQVLFCWAQGSVCLSV